MCELSAGDSGEDVFGHKQLTGTVLFLANVCAKQLGVKTRAIELSTLQRCSGHIASLTDINEAFSAGERAVKAAVEGQSGVAAILVRAGENPYVCKTDIADVMKIANAEKCVPVEWIDTVNAYMLPAFLNYARPLIQGELNPYYENGLPKHLINN